MTGSTGATRRRWSRVLSALPPGRRRWAIVALVGWWLSPLTVWNDAFTNIPLSIAIVYLLRWAGWQIEPRLAAVEVYLITNIVGLLLLWLGLGKISSGGPPPLREGRGRRILLRTLGYAAMVFLTVWALERMLAELPLH